MRKKLLTGLSAIILTAVPSFLVGRSKGFDEGFVKGKEEIITGLSMQRYDIQQAAKFAGSTKEQEEVLKNAGAINQTLRDLYQRGYFSNISPWVEEEAVGYFTDDYKRRDK